MLHSFQNFLLGELLGLMWQDIDWHQRTLLVQRQVQHPKGGGYVFSPPKSNSGNRTIILGQQAIEVLKLHRTEIIEMKNKAGNNWEDLGLVFPSLVGTPITKGNLRRNLKKVLKESDLPKIRFHDLRHTAASLMLNNGIPVLIVSKRLGHSKPSITMDVYGHMIPSKQEEAATLMDELMSPINVTNCTIFASMKASVKRKAIPERKFRLQDNYRRASLLVDMKMIYPDVGLRIQLEPKGSGLIRCIYSCSAWSINPSGYQ
ncbi:site-specific integrase [Chloroflexota bacterium]